MIEIWRDIKDYEGLYQVSNFGRVKSLPRNTPAGMRGGKILKPIDAGNGYLRVNLSKGGKPNLSLVHRLVAEAFLENSDNLPCVNHKDENPSNNRVENLEWCTYEYNNNYGTRNEKVAIKTSQRCKGVYNTKCSKTVYQFTLDGEFVREWPSTKEVHRQTGYHQGSISKCCNGKRKHVAGYKWSYDRDFLLLRPDNSNLTSLPSC